MSAGVSPRPMPTPDLAGLLAKPLRTARSAPAPSSEQGRPVKTETRAPAAVDTPPRQPDPPEEGGADRANRGAKGLTRQYLRTITVYLPRSLHRHLSERAEATDTTRTALMLQAVNATHHNLAELLAKSVAAGGEDGDLFDIPQKRMAAEPSVQTSIRVTDRQLEALDELATRHTAQRSHLIAAALTAYLPQES
jgi:predicted transcriptional regulator